MISASSFAGSSIGSAPPPSTQRRNRTPTSGERKWQTSVSTGQVVSSLSRNSRSHAVTRAWSGSLRTKSATRGPVSTSAAFCNTDTLRSDDYGRNRGIRGHGLCHSGGQSKFNRDVSSRASSLGLPDVPRFPNSFIEFARNLRIGRYSDADRLTSRPKRQTIEIGDFNLESHHVCVAVDR